MWLTLNDLYDLKEELFSTNTSTLKMKLKFRFKTIYFKTWKFLLQVIKCERVI